MEKYISGILAISGIFFIVLGLISFEMKSGGNIFSYECFGSGTALLIVAIIKMLQAKETKTLTIKKWFWIGLTCTVVIVAYVMLKIFDPIEVLLYGGAVVLLAAIAIPYACLQSKRFKRAGKLPPGYIDSTRAQRPMGTVCRYSMNRFSMPLRLIFWFIVIIASAGLVILVAINSSEMKQLEKPLRQKYVRQVHSIEGDLSSDMVVCELWLYTNDHKREYRLIDSPSDVYFPNDADGLVDSVSSRPYAYRRKDRSQWRQRPFEQTLYEVLTEKYIEKISETTSYATSAQGSDIKRPYRYRNPERYRYITRRERRNYRNIVIVLAVFTGVFVVLGYLRRKCPACSRNWGLKRTGNKQNLNAGKSRRFRLPIHPDYTYEYQCKSCGHIEWIRFSLNPYDRT